MLWIVGAIVAMLFLAALWRVSTRHAPEQRTGDARRTAKTALVPTRPMFDPSAQGTAEPVARRAAIRYM